MAQTQQDYQDWLVAVDKWVDDLAEWVEGLPEEDIESYVGSNPPPPPPPPPHGG